MKLNRITIEHTLYAAALLLALWLRFYNLGSYPLSDAEAGWANQALALARGTSPAALGPQPGYLTMTAGLFGLLGSSNALARFWPALAGSLLVLAPLAARRELGRTTALVLAFGLALDPGLVAVARQAGSSMPALALTLVALAFWRSDKPLAAGIAAGLALLGGPGVLPGLIGLLLAAGLSGAWKAPDGIQSGKLRATGAAALFTMLLAGTAFLRLPSVLGAALQAPLVYISGWGTASGIPLLRSLAALAFYSPLALVFAIAALVRWILELLGIWTARQDDSMQIRAFSLAWFGSALLLALFYPARQTADLVWALVPLWILAASEIAPRLPRPGAQIISLVQALIVFVLAALFTYTLAALQVLAPGDSQTALRLGVLLGILALGGLTGVLFALGWSYEASRDGLTWGSVAALLVLMMSGLWGATQERPNMPQELWGQPPASGQAALLTATIGDLAELQTGDPRAAEIVSTIDSQSLRWLLRDYQVSYTQDISPAALPSLMITTQENAQPQLSTSYRGQDFIWWISPGWDGALPPDFIRWLIYRKAPVQETSVILWARADIFPGGLLQSPSSEPDVPIEDPYDTLP